MKMFCVVLMVCAVVLSTPTPPSYLWGDAGLSVKKKEP